MPDFAPASLPLEPPALAPGTRATRTADVLGVYAQPARQLLRAGVRRRHRRHREGGERRPDRLLEPDQQPVRRHRLPGQPEAPQHPRRPGLPDPRGAPRGARARRHRDARRPRSRRPSRSAPPPASRPSSSSRPASRRSAPRAPSWSARSWRRRGPTGSGSSGPNCLGVMRPPTGLNATFAAGISAPGIGRLRQPERRAPHRRPRLEHAREGRLQRRRLARLDARRRLGRRHHLLRQRPGDREHRHLHGDDRRRPGLPVGRPRGRPDQADHRHQAGPDGAGGQGRRLAHRLADRLRRGPRRGVPARRRAARRRDRRPLRRRRGARQAAAAEGATG